MAGGAGGQAARAALEVDGQVARRGGAAATEENGRRRRLTGSGGEDAERSAAGGASASLSALSLELRELLRDAMAEHEGALRELDAKRREVNAIERDVYERRWASEREQ